MFERITVNPKVLGGKPCIRGMRVPVHLILDLVAAGKSSEDVLNDYPYLEKGDITQALEYAAWLAREESLEVARQG